MIHAADATTSDASAGDAAPGVVTVHDASVTDGAATDAGIPDGTITDAYLPDATMRDANVVDGAVSDAALQDADSHDAATPDASSPPDAGSCPCSQGLVCVDGRCLPGCSEDETCGTTDAACDDGKTAWCQCPYGRQPCGDACCPVTIEAVHSPQFTGNVGMEGLALRLDHHGHPHLALYELLDAYSGTGSLWCARHDGSEWIFEVVEEDKASGPPALVLDDLDQPHLAYATWSVAVVYAFRHEDTGLFEKHNVEARSGYMGGSHDILLAGSPVQVHICSSRIPAAGGNLSLVYGHGQPGALSLESIDDDGATDPSLVLSAAGVPHVAFSDSNGATDQLKYAVRTGPAAWSVSTLVSNLSQRANPSLRIGHDGASRIAFRDATLKTLRVAVQRSASQWDLVTLDPPASGDSGWYPALVVEPFNDMLVAYAHSTGFTLHVRLLRYRNGLAHISTVDTGTGPEGVGDHMAMDVAPDGTIMVAYHDWDQHNVRLARW